MKKIMLSAAMLAFAGMATVNANPIQPVGIYASVNAQDERTPIKIEDLPDEIKTTLSGEEYAGWAPTEAFEITPTDGDKYFEVNLNKEGESKVVNFDQSGKAVTVPDAGTEVQAPEAPTQEPTETPDPTQTPTPESTPETPAM